MMSFTVLAAALAETLMSTGIAEPPVAQGSRPLQGQVPIGDPDDDDEGTGDDEDEDEEEDEEEPWQVHPAGVACGMLS